MSTDGATGGTGRIAISTVAAANYLGRVIVMARSLARHHPELDLFVALTDRAASEIDLGREPFKLVDLSALGLSELPRLTFALDREQLCVVAKPAMLRAVLRQGFDSVLHIDPDAIVTGDLRSLLETTGRSTITLTPHLLDQAGADWELAILLSGTFNAGVVGVSASGGGIDFLDWWLDRTAWRPENAVGDGVYFDQRWLDLVPSLFDHVSIVRDPGVNVAYWNMAQRRLELRGGELWAGGQPARIVHFSSFDPAVPERAASHFGTIPAASFGEKAASLFADYAREVEKAESELEPDTTYGFGKFSTGEPIPAEARLIYRELGDDAAGFGDPFDAAHPQGFAEWLNSPAFGASDPGDSSGQFVTRLWERIYRLRPDVQAAYPDISGSDREEFLGWITADGASEHSIPRRFVP